VVPRSVEGLPEEMQVTPSTSRTAEVLGKYLHYSPSKIDHLIRGYAAGLGRNATDIIDRWLGDPRTRPEVPMAERIPVLKGLIAKEPRGYGSSSVEAFSRLWEDMDKNYRGLKTLYDRGDMDALAERVKANRRQVGFYEDAKQIRRFLSQVRKEMQAVQASDLTPHEKKAVLDRMGDAMTQVTRNFLRAYYGQK
jgi:hypothetical protein